MTNPQSKTQDQIITLIRDTTFTGQHQLNWPVWKFTLWVILHPVRFGELAGRVKFANEIYRAVTSGRQERGQ